MANDSISSQVSTHGFLYQQLVDLCLLLQGAITIREFASCSFVVILVYHKREIGNFYICSFTYIYIYISTKLKLVTKRVLTSTDMNKKKQVRTRPKT